MRTKQTGKRKVNVKMNGAQSTPGHLPTPPIQDVKSPTQPHELNEKDRAKLKAHLDKTPNPFSLTTVPLSRKRKRAGPQLQTQTDLFEDRLAVQYEIKPAQNWESLRRYKKFTVGAESIAVGECIMVKHDDTEDARIDWADQWKAKVLEVRALDPEHVYLRVAWLNRPEDLDAGRKAYHGKNELIPTNQMDIIDAMAVNGRLEVYHWVEADDDSLMPGSEEYFWRQTFDFVNTKTFSKLRLICIDSAPQNPDEIILQCSNEDCRKWLHVKCVAEDAVRRAVDSSAEKTKSPKKRGRPKALNIGANSPAIAKAQKGTFTSEVFVKGQPDGPNHKPAATTEIVITSEDGEQLAEDVCCLFCGVKID